MERRNLDFGIEVTADQWDELRRTAAARGPEQGFGDAGDDLTGDIRVFLDDERGPSHWREFLVGDDETYGATTREVAHFHFNGGRPFASIELPRVVDEPAFTDTQEHAMQRELEDWLRNRWHELMRASGLHYERGHIPQSGTEERERYS